MRAGAGLAARNPGWPVVAVKPWILHTHRNRRRCRDVRQIFKEHVTDEVVAESAGQDHSRGGGPKFNALFNTIHAGGWLGIAHPKE